MWKPMLAGTVALALSGSSLALAQQRPAPATPQTTPSAPTQSAPTSPSVPKATPQKPAASQQPSAEERAAAARREEQAAAARREEQAEDQAELEGRIASLKAGLMLTEDQAKNWPAFEKAYREFVKVRIEQWGKFRDWQRSDNPIENMEARADFAIRRAAAMKEFAAAAMPLYNSLDPSQQRRLRSEGLRGLMMMAHRGYGPRWRDRDDNGPRWRDRGEGDRDYGPRWGRRGDNDDGYYGGHHGWHHRGDGMMGPRSGWRDRRDDDDRSGGYSDDGADRDRNSDNGGNRSGSQPLGPDEERF
jgi:hypothetical protein